jgi:hypothetical protein
VHVASQRLRRRAADIAIRSVGALLLGLCAASACWLYRSVNRPPVHATSALEFAATALVVLCWALGWAAVGEGQALFRLVEAPGRCAHLDSIDKGIPL